MDTYPHLRTFLDSWFHQDFELGGDTLQEIVFNYKKSVYDDELQATRNEIAAFLNRFGGDQANFAKTFEAIFSPGVIVEGWDGMTSQEWLEAIGKWLA